METISTSRRLRGTYNGYTVEGNVSESVNSQPAIDSGQINRADGSWAGSFGRQSDGSTYFNFAPGTEWTTAISAISTFITEALVPAITE